MYWDIYHRILDIIPIIQQWNFLMYVAALKGIPKDMAKKKGK